MDDVLKMKCSPEPVMSILKAGGYAAVLSNPTKQIDLQDALDHILSTRLIDVRNALRDLGWKGAQTLFNPDGVEAKFKIDHAGYGANVVGFSVNGIRDMLNCSAQKFAVRVSNQAFAQTLGGERIEEGPFEGFLLVPQKSFGVNAQTINVRNADGQMIGYVEQEDVAEFKNGSIDHFRPVSDWRSRFSTELQKKLGLADRVEVPDNAVLYLPINEYRPEALCVTQESEGNFLVQTNRGQGWLPQKEHGREAEAITDAQNWYPDPQKEKADMQKAESPQERLEFVEAQIASHHYGAEHAGLTNDPEWRDHLKYLLEQKDACIREIQEQEEEPGLAPR